jgi:hypothetical protein
MELGLKTIKEYGNDNFVYIHLPFVSMRQSLRGWRMMYHLIGWILRQSVGKVQIAHLKIG